MSPYPQVAVPVSRRLAAKARLKSVAHRAEGGDPTVEKVEAAQPRERSGALGHRSPLPAVRLASGGGGGRL
jgi:hypothetical protein